MKTVEGRYLLGNIWPLAEKIAEYLRGHEVIADAVVAGSIRRRSEIVRDINIVVATLRAAEALDVVAAMPGVQHFEINGTRLAAVLSTGMILEVVAVKPEHFTAAVHFATGSNAHYEELKQYAETRHFDLPITINNEREFYLALELQYIEPELREGLGEITQAALNGLPVLVNDDNLKGAFHVHTSYSDGENSVPEMVAAAEKHGWGYLGVADHSQTASYAHGLKVAAVLAQRREIDKLNQNSKVYIFAGIESDILPDGSLDYSADILEQFDFVIASVHSAFRQGKERMTERIIKAMENPYVTMLGHPTGRILLARQEYAVDIPAVIKAAAETGTMIEINASPRRLDLDWRWCRLAKKQGVLLSVNPDAHNVDELSYVHYGVAAARKGWLAADDILNTRSAADVAVLLRQKRQKIKGGI